MHGSVSWLTDNAEGRLHRVRECERRPVSPPSGTAGGYTEDWAAARPLCLTSDPRLPLREPRRTGPQRDRRPWPGSPRRVLSPVARGQILCHSKELLKDSREIFTLAFLQCMWRPFVMNVANIIEIISIHVYSSLQLADGLPSLIHLPVGNRSVYLDCKVRLENEEGSDVFAW